MKKTVCQFLPTTFQPKQPWLWTNLAFFEYGSTTVIGRRNRNKSLAWALRVIRLNHSPMATSIWASPGIATSLVGAWSPTLPLSSTSAILATHWWYVENFQRYCKRKIKMRLTCWHHLCVTMFFWCYCNQGRRRAGMTGALPPAFSKGGQRGWRCLFITALWIISRFITTDLKQIYCSYSRTQKIQDGFL